MANILTATITITGTRVLLWNRFTSDTIPLGGRRERTGTAGNDPSEWQRSVLITPSRQLYLDPTAIFGCLRDAARYTSRKRGTLQPFVAATLQVLDERVLIDRFLPEHPDNDSNQLVYIDVRSVRNPATRARNVRYRVATAPGWHATFSIQWDATMVSRQEMLAVLLDAGRFTGLGDGRAVGFGRFTLDLERDVQLTEAG